MEEKIRMKADESTEVLVRKCSTMQSVVCDQIRVGCSCRNGVEIDDA
jgi:hypothetical protein